MRPIWGTFPACCAPATSGEVRRARARLTKATRLSIICAPFDPVPLDSPREAERGAHLRGGRRAEGLTAAAAGEAAWFGGAKRDAESGCERSERRVLADVRSMSARTSYSTVLCINTFAKICELERASVVDLS